MTLSRRATVARQEIRCAGGRPPTWSSGDFSYDADPERRSLKEAPIPIDEALSIALRVAEALEAAHDSGVVHRDLKPANLQVTPDGKVKILDFGLAKALDSEVSSSRASISPTLTTPAVTRAGVILGTAAYMSPEQAKGKPVDRRADVSGCAATPD